MESRALRYLDIGVVTGVLLLVLFVFRSADVGPGWRIGLIIVSCLSVFHALLSRNLPWENLPAPGRRLALAWVGVVLLMAVASWSGATFVVSSAQFWQGFVLPATLPVVLMAHFRTAFRWKALLLAIIGATLLAMARNAVQYGHEWSELGRVSNNIHLHRHYAEALIFGLPFLFFAACLPGVRWRRLAWSLPFLSLLMIAGTGARGAWLAAAAVVATYALLLRSKRFVVVVSALGLATAILAAAVIPTELMAGRLKQGMDTSLRTTGTWKPAIEMIADRPVLGYGFGDDVFHSEFNRRAPSSPDWSVKASIGPHNFFLAAGFATGYTGLVVLLVLIGYAMWQLASGSKQLLKQPGEAHGYGLSGVALLGAIVGLYVVMGMVENINWHLFAFWLGLLLVWLQLATGGRAENKETE